MLPDILGRNRNYSWQFLPENRSRRNTSLFILGVSSNSYPLNRWYHPTISSSAIPFYCLQSFPASGYFTNWSILKQNQHWIVIGRTDAEAEAPTHWPPDVKSWLNGKYIIIYHVICFRDHALQNTREFFGNENQHQEGKYINAFTFICSKNEHMQIHAHVPSLYSDGNFNLKLRRFWVENVDKIQNNVSKERIKCGYHVRLRARVMVKVGTLVLFLTLGDVQFFF